VVDTSSSTPGSLPAGTSGELSLSFAPTSAVSLSGSLVLTDNNLNVVAPSYATQTIPLSGTGTPATPTITWPASPVIAYGTALTAAQLDASSTVAGTFAYNPPLGTVLNVGTQTLSVTFTPTDTADYTTAMATTSLGVSVAVPVLVFAPIGSQVYGAAPFAVSASSASTGLVAYAVVSGPATISGNMITLTGAGTVLLSANQTSTTSYAAATATTSFTVAAPFALTSATNSGSSGGSASVAPGAAASFSFALTPGVGGAFLDAIAFSAAGLPAGSTATFSPATIAAGAAATSLTLSIQTATFQGRSKKHRSEAFEDFCVVLGSVWPRPVKMSPLPSCFDCSGNRERRAARRGNVTASSRRPTALPQPARRRRIVIPTLRSCTQSITAPCDGRPSLQDKEILAVLPPRPDTGSPCRR
jgi:hypothetical protein